RQLSRIESRNGLQRIPRANAFHACTRCFAKGPGLRARLGALPPERIKAQGSFNSDRHLVGSTLSLTKRRSNMPTTTTAPTATKTTASPATAKGAKPPKPLPAPNSDFYYLYETLPAEELAVVKHVREFVETKVAPVITDYWVKDQFPFDLLPAVKELGIGGLGMKGYGCAGGSLALLGFVQMEIARIDPSFSTFVGVHNGLAMGSIYIDGSEEQKQKWLPPMARFDKVDCFALTEPLEGYGASGRLLTTAKR